MFTIRYPKILRKINDICGLISGCLAFVIGALFVYQAVARYIFQMKTSFVEDLGSYVFCFAVFLACSRGFQDGGHVGIDMLRTAISKRTKTTLPRRTLAVIGYLQAEFFLGIMLYASYISFSNAVKFGMTTAGTFSIPQYWLYGMAILGFAMMIITVFFVILDLLSGSDEFL